MNKFLLSFWRVLGLSKQIQLRIMRIFNDEFLIGVTGIFFNNKNEILVVKHRYRSIRWSLPGGYLKAKEHPSEGLEREIDEETGFIVSADKLLKVRTDRHTGRLDMSYVGTFIGGEFRKSDEVVDFRFCTLENLPDIISDQVILIKEALDTLSISNREDEPNTTK